jgi:glycosyltransferase involved in cell wall biosynthesis
MKIAWLCSYPLFRFRDKIFLKGISSEIHPATWIYFLNRELGRDPNLDIHLITVTNQSEKDVIFKEGNTTYYVLTLGRKSWPNVLRRAVLEANRYSGFRYSNAKAIRYIKKIKPDIVNAHGTEQYGSALNNLPFPRMLSMQGVMNYVYKNEGDYFSRILKRNEIRVFTKQCYFSTVPGNMEDIISHYNPRARFFHLWYPVSDFAFELKRKPIEINADVVFVGALVKRKGIDDLIAAIMIMKKKHPEIKVKIIGPASSIQNRNMDDKIEKLGLRKNIQKIGFLNNHNDVLNEIKKSKIFVLPTHVDTGPRSVAEAQAMGVPVVSYNIDGLPNMIQNDRSGILVEKGDISGLAESIMNLLTDAAKRRILAENAYQFALENFSAASVAKKYLRAYKDIMDNPL